MARGARSATATDGFRQPVARLAARAVLDFGYDKTAL